MTLVKQKQREVLLQLLYSQSTDFVDEDQIEFLMQHHEISKKSVCQIIEHKNRILTHLTAIDQFIAQHSKEYAFERISKVEKSVLRLSVYDLCFDKETPPKVVIAEAIRLARKFGGPEGATFVNAVLDAVYQCELKKENS